MKINVMTFAIALAMPFGAFADFVPPTQKCGDFNNDGAITSSDALGILRSSVSGSSCPLHVCDTNNDKKVTASDSQAVLKAAVGSGILNCQIPTDNAQILFFNNVRCEDSYSGDTDVATLSGHRKYESSSADYTWSTTFDSFGGWERLDLNEMVKTSWKVGLKYDEEECDYWTGECETVYYYSRCDTLEVPGKIQLEYNQKYVAFASTNDRYNTDIYLNIIAESEFDQFVQTGKVGPLSKHIKVYHDRETEVSPLTLREADGIRKQFLKRN